MKRVSENRVESFAHLGSGNELSEGMLVDGNPGFCLPQFDSGGAE